MVEYLSSGEINFLHLIISVNGSAQKSNEDSLRVNWETFDEQITSTNRPHSIADPAAKEPSLQTRDSPQHNTMGYALPLPKKPDDPVARRTPPPLPKPYSRKNNPSESKAAYFHDCNKS
jgi:hypothetical protein